MAGKSKVARVPKKFMSEVDQLMKAEQLASRTEAIRKMSYYANIGRQTVKRDLLGVNVEWFNRNMSTKKRLFKKKK